MGATIGMIHIICYIIIIGCSTWFIFSIIKKKRIGIILAIVIMFFPLYVIIEYEYSYQVLTNNIKNDLKILDIQLNEEFRFKIQTSSPRSEILGASKMVEIVISEKDKLELIKQIKNSKNFIELKTKQEIKRDHYKIDDSNYNLNYKYPEYYSRKVLTKIDNKQIKIDLQINLFGTLKYDKRNILSQKYFPKKN